MEPGYKHRNKRRKAESSPDNDKRYTCMRSTYLPAIEPEELHVEKEETGIYGAGWARCFRRLNEEIES